MQLSGNDISNYQGVVDWDTYKNNSNFVIIKASEGLTYTDTYLERNQAEVRRVALPHGYYHFCHPDLGNNPVDEATFFLEAIGQLQEGEVLCLDFEVSASDPVGWCKEFLDTVFIRTGVKPFIYLNKSQVRGNDWSPIASAGYGLWLACYDNNLITGAWQFVAMQQWTDAQSVPGVQGGIDGDRFFGTAQQFLAYGYHKSSPSASVSPSSSVSSSVSSTPSPTPSSSVSPSASVSASISPSASVSPSAPVPPVPPPLHQGLWEAFVEFIKGLFSEWHS